MPDPKSKSAWEAANVIQVAVKINRTQDPDLYRLLSESDSKSALARELMRQAINQKG